MYSGMVAMRFALETVSGTFVQPVTADYDCELIGVGLPTFNFNNASLGIAANGSFASAGVAGGKRQVDIPEFAVQIRGSSDEAITPKWFKYAKCGGWKEETITGAKAIVFDNVPSCDTLSAEIFEIGCDGKVWITKVAGVKGNFDITAEGSNASLLGKCTGWTGKFVSRTEGTAFVPFVVTGGDAGVPQTIGMYTAKWGATVYTVATLGITAGGSITHRPANDPSGIAFSRMTGAESNLTFTGLHLLSADTVFTDALACTVNTFALEGSAGNGASYDLTMTGCQIINPSSGDVEGNAAWDVDSIYRRVEFKLKTIP